MSLKATLSRHLRNLKGWRTDRKILVIESDDWGGIRMPSKAVYQELLAEGLRVDKCPYNTYDNLENSEDLNALFNTLQSIKDSKGNSAVVTANYNVANPDFEKIKASGYTSYHYKLFTETFKEYYPSESILEAALQGTAQKVFMPQYHSREHVNAPLWLQHLRDGHKAALAGFKRGVYGLSFATSPTFTKPYLASLIYTNNEEKAFIENAIVEGADIFKQHFGYSSTSFIAPIYLWDYDLEPTLQKIGVKYLQGANFHRTYNAAESKLELHREVLGNKSGSGQIYLSRNCYFEPSFDKTPGASIQSCMQEIDAAFTWKKPAVISAHRLNFVGSLVEGNRNKNLQSLKTLLTAVLKKYPDVEFMTTPQLGDLIAKG